MHRPSVISLFSGAGGLDLGFHAAGTRTAVAIEMDADCCRTLRENRARGYGWEVIEAKIENVPSADVLAAAALESGDVDIVIGGPPCQPFSKSGYWASGDSGRLRDPRANTLHEYLRIVRDVRPRAFLLENVTGLAYSGKEEGFRFLFSEIEKINADTGTRYAVSAQVLNAADYGVPQTRERILLIGSRDGRRFRFPQPTHFDPGCARAGADMFDQRVPWRTAWDALGDLPEPEDLQETRTTGRWAELLPSIPEGQNYLWHTDRGGGVPLFGWRRRYWSFLLKLAKDRPAWTVTAQPGPAIGPFHWNNRRLSRRELMRIQTFPDNYIVTGDLRAAQRQIGNAVPSALAEVLAREILVQLLDWNCPSAGPTLIPPVRMPRPEPGPPRAVSAKYLQMVGEHAAHPGTGQGYGALRRAASAGKRRPVRAA